MCGSVSASASVNRRFPHGDGVDEAPKRVKHMRKPLCPVATKLGGWASSKGRAAKAWGP